MSELPISVIVPHVYSREKFFLGRCLPSILRNKPKEIIVVGNDGSTGTPAEARNQGIRAATQPYLMLVDDDTILYPYALGTLLDTLKNSRPDVGFAYPDYKVKVAPGVVSNLRDDWVVKGIEWDFQAFMQSNYVTNMSLIRMAASPVCDKNLKRLIDWDMFIAMAMQGWMGIHCPSVLFEAHQIDKSVSMAVTDDVALAAVRKKWNVI